MVAILGEGEQTKPIFQMCHYRPMYYIVHCDVQYTNPEGRVNSAWLGGVEFFRGEGVLPLMGWLAR